jgi:hypothetical protein
MPFVFTRAFLIAAAGLPAAGRAIDCVPLVSV